MRRCMSRLALLGAVLLLAAGCGQPGGIDGMLDDDWPAFGALQVFTPSAGVCISGDLVESVHLATDVVVDCTVAHRAETVYVSTFPDGLTAPPAVDSPQRRAAFADCDTRASAYVGGDWRGARLRLGVGLPSPVTWAGGAHWYRCDLVEVTRVDGGQTVSRTGSLRDALRGDSPLRLGCYTARLDNHRIVRELLPTECRQSHDVEFVGAWRAPETVAYPVGDRDWLRFYTECRTLIARYVNVPDDTWLRLRSGVVPTVGTAQQWRAGDRGVRCYLWLNDRTVTTSLRGGGLAALPFSTGRPRR